MIRISKETLKANGFKQINSMQAYQRGGIIVSYGLIVAINQTSAKGYHDYSSTTSKQVTRASGVGTLDRRKKWNIVSADKFEAMAKKIIDSLE
jgi:hypothetical protein